MPTLRYIIRCAAGRSTCVTINKCCCYTESIGPGGTRILTPVPAVGVPVTVKLGDTVIASGSADSNGKFCFRPCQGGAYTLVLGAQGVCVASSASWAVDICGGPDILTTQAMTPGYYCCNGIQIPTQVMVTDSNGSWVGNWLTGATASPSSVAHAGDHAATEVVGRVKFTSSTPQECIFGIYGDGNCCIGADEGFGLILKTVLVEVDGPLSYGYGLTCGFDEGGVYLEATLAYEFGLFTTTDYSYNGWMCCLKNGVMICPPHTDVFPDCTTYPDLGTPYNWEIDPYTGVCRVVDPSPIPSGPCKCYASYSGGYVERTINNRIYIGDINSCTKLDGPWTFNFSPGPVNGYPAPTWQFSSDVDCPYPTIIPPLDHGICPPPPGGASITVSGYFP